ncbi:hypothetical protein [Leekyejoonella antrihumi]|uniref:Uncharacterized protein n=1 Tax=Leekyejoonella antrihumi TaxID=1660198 RepID=A0A563E7K3_9MICO|nr:hypothetical protein [Leekyejoonella antrihumi]TWP38506.1 hypothetical protein FGL98_01535 [Leekyejoonella antrihumi]
MFKRPKKPVFPAYGSSVPKPFADLEPEGPTSPLTKLSRAPRLPPEARELLRQIDTMSTTTLRHLAELPGANVLAVVRVETIRDNDAPDVVAAFLGVPLQQVDAVLIDGRTAAQVLIDDLQVLASAVQTELSAARSSGSVTPAMVQHRFIADKYGSLPPEADPS